MALACPRCGAKKTLGTFCQDCLRELHPLVKKIKEAKLTLCSTCGRTKLAHEWKNTSVPDAMQRAVAQSLIFGDGTVTSVEVETVPLEHKPGLKRKITVLAIVTGSTEGTQEYEEEYEVPFAYEGTVCPLCAKKGSSYYEGILQIRNQNINVRTAIFEYLKTQKSKGVRLAKEVPVGSGSDYYISDQRAVNHLSKQLNAQFGGELKVSAQHFSYDHAAGKNLYRVNAYLEIPEFAKGDVIRRDDAYYYILGVRNKIKAENLQTGRQESFTYVKGTATALPIKTTTVSNIDPIEVLHPTNFQSVVPTNSKYAPAELEMDENVSVAVDGQFLFLIPHTKEKAVQKYARKRHSQKRKTKDDDLIRDD